MQQREQQHPREGRALVILAALGVAATGWAAFLWQQLVAARRGAEPFCGFGGGDCSALWDGALAGRVHDLTGVPVAGWGMIWGLVALVLPLALRQGWLGDSESAQDPQRWGIRLTALAGAAGVAMLVASSIALGMFCTSCAVTYVLVLAYLAVAFWGLVEPVGGLVRGGVVAVVAVAVAFAGALYPGLQTPKKLADEGHRVLSETVGLSGAAPSGAVIDRPAQLKALLDSLSEPMRQALADSIFVYNQNSTPPADVPRALVGSDDAPVMITEFTDIRCGHCADLHATLAYMKSLLPPESFSVDARQFPLDSDCNPFISGPREDDVRCLAALAQICMEGNPLSFEFSGELFKSMRTLTRRQVVAIGSKYMDQSTLEVCMAAPETGEKLKADLEYAARYRPEGTPLVLINGRKAPHFGPFLYAMVLTEGAVDDPAFTVLPQPSQLEGRE